MHFVILGAVFLIGLFWFMKASVTPAVIGSTINPQGDIGGKSGELLRGVQIGTPTIGTPASAAAAGVKGQVCFDGSFIYVCTADNTWLRGAVATW